MQRCFIALTLSAALMGMRIYHDRPSYELGKHLEQRADVWREPVTGYLASEIFRPKRIRIHGG
jgi:hypothetical protein